MTNMDADYWVKKHDLSELFLFALCSNYHRERFFYTIGSISVSLIGLVIAVLGSSTKVRYAGV